MKTPDLKPCQGVARGSIKWREDLYERGFVCRADCKHADRHAEGRVSYDCMNGLVKNYTERELLCILCDECKEAAYENA